MRENLRRYSWGKRLLAFALALLMVAGYFPTVADAASAPGTVETVADLGTLPRVEQIYGKNTMNAGKVSVGKSVSDTTVELPTGESFTPAKNNFIVTVSQTAQVMGLAAESSVPVDVVFVLDTSGSMDENNRKSTMVTAVNNAIKTLMASNANNRVGVVAFSDIDTNSWGQVTEPAAEVLSNLASYTDNAATNHLTWSGSNIVGRGTGAGSRDGGNGGTNIQAGVALGAKMLASATDLTVDGVTRMPFLIILSDGAPTYNFTDTNWYNPNMNGSQYGPGNDEGTLYTGNGFLPALVAAYYKGVITEHYYGTNASEVNRCSIYTLGVSLDNSTLAKLTMDPDANFNANATGNSHGARFATYWKNYQAGNTFSISCHNNENYSITKNSINATKNYVNGISSTGKTMYTGGIAYNDDYYNATNTSDINSIFDRVVTEIQKKAISSPTHVGTHGADFSGYVTFTDPLGAYMELKDMKGIVADGHFYQGASAARHLSAFGKTGNANNDPEFDALLKSVLQKRLSMTSSQANDAFISEFARQALASDYQAYWNSNSDFDNSIVWWGNRYPTNEEDEMVQVLGFADDDSIEYIQAQQAANAVPADADYVCRSYFFYGTAGNTVQNPDHEYLYFVIRVQRELTAPYKQTVVISAPASLLAVEEVFITEETGTNGTKTYTAEVTPAAPARVVYEVGLRSDINAQNVDSMITDGYKNEKPVDGNGSVNYDAATGTYYFFTNDWDRNEALGEHHRAKAKATFDAAADNAFYTYQQDTQVYVKNGDNYTPYTGSTAPMGVYYYAREYYDWSDSRQNSDGTYDAEKKTAWIAVGIEDASSVKQSGGNWYIKKGLYTASTLVVNGDDAEKSDNKTGTAEIVAHPHRTGSSSNSHYTVLLGNNGRLAVVSDPVKSVSIGNSGTNDNGKPVMVGDVLTYTIKVVNNEGVTANAVVTDTVPKGTEFVSADNNGQRSQDGKTVRWELTNIPAGGSRTVSFTVKVLPSAISGPNSVDTINNTATVQVGNNPAYTTNTVTNPPEGKKVTDTSGNELGAGTSLKVGDVLVYRVRAYNDTGAKADVTITDSIPAGTTYVPGSADHNGVLSADGKTLTWNIQGVDAGASVVVSFQVEVDASAKTSVNNEATIKVGPNDPGVTTNTVTTPVGVGDLSVKKVVASGSSAETFTIYLTEAEGKLDGEYAYTLTDATANVVAEGMVEFEKGNSDNIDIKGGQTLTIKDLPRGTRINVAEGANAGWTPSYNVGTEVVNAAFVTVSGNTPVVTVTNNYHAQPAHFQLKGTKTFVGSKFPAGSFTFNAVQVADKNGTPLTGATPIQVTATVKKETANNKDNPLTTMDIVFDARSFTTAMERYYKITESASDIPGVISDSTAYLLMLKVEDDGNGQLVAKAWLKNSQGGWDELDWAKNKEALSFTNYYPEDVAAEINVTKTLYNRYIQDKEFTFELVENGRVVDTVILGADGNSPTGSFKFTRKYTAADMGGANSKTFDYIVREVQGADSSIAYDHNERSVSVTVVRNGATLTASVDYKNSDNCVDFVNTFTPAGTTLTLEGTKILKDGVTNTQVTSGIPTFSFGVYDEADKQVASGTNDSNGVIKFSPIGYTFARLQSVSPIDGVRKITIPYTVKENIPAEGAPTRDHSMRYSTEEYEIEVTVTYRDSDGKMEAWLSKVGSTTIAKENSDDYRFAFENTKYPETVSVTPVASKTVTGSNVPEGLRFSFSVVNAKTNVEAATGISAATVDLATGSNTGLPVEFTHMVYDYSNWRANRDDPTVENSDATLYYWIQESNTANGWVDQEHPGNGIKYDTTRYLMKVVLTYDNGKLTATETYYRNIGATLEEVAVETNKLGENEVATFTNDYNAAGFINLTAEKKIEGGSGWAADDFDFHLQRLNADGTVVEDSEIVGINGDVTRIEDKTEYMSPITFATLNYSAKNLVDGTNSGTVRYVMTEVNPGAAAIPGVTYDTNAYIVTIKLERELDQNQTATGKINASVESVQKAKFTGEGAERIYSVDTGTTGGSLAVTPPVEGDNTNNWVTNTWNIGGTAFTNKYTPNSVDVEIKATKTLTGRALNAGEFGFELYRIQKNETTGQIEEFLAATATNQKENNEDTIPDNIIFKRTYNAENLSSAEGGYTVTYAIKETKGSLGGVTYTGDVFYAQVDIEHSQDEAKYVVEDIRYYKDNPLEEDGTATIAESAVVFENSYTTNNAHYTPVAFKELEGKVMTNGQFTFSVIELNRNTFAETHTVAAGVNNADGTVDFSRLTYSHNATLMDAHSHYYKIVEDEGNEIGITYDSTAYYLKVTIQDNHQGVLCVVQADYFASIEDMTGTTPKPFATHKDANHDGEWHVDEIEYVSENGQRILFTNHYGPGYVTIQPSDLKKVVKVEGRENVVYNLEGSEFDFDLYEAAGADGWDLGNLVTSGTNGASVDGVAPINFGSITYTSEQVRAAGTKDADGNPYATYNYIVVERDLDAASDARGLEKDGKKIKLTITVTDDGYGNLTAKVSKVNDKDIGAVTDADRTFTNTYAAESPVQVTITADKTLINKKLTANEFEFKLEWEENGQTTGTILKNDADGKITYTKTFTAPGVYTYTMREVGKNSDNYKCDDSVYTIVVNVTDDLAGKLHATTTYYKNYNATEDAVNNPVAGIDFVNTYKPSSVTVDLSTAIGATKTVLDPNGNKVDGKAEGFDFEMIDVTGAKIAEGTADKNGEISFKPIEFKTAGEYHFRIRETENADKPGYTMDQQQWRVYVLVRYYDGNGTAPVINGTPVTPGSLYIDAADVQTFLVSEMEAHSEQTPVFVNIYNPEPLHLTLKATKQLNGRDLRDGEFTFHLVEGGILRGEAKNKADGSINFVLNYNMPGTYTYELHEHVPAAADKLEGVTYDERTHTVTVTVKDQNGKLVVEGVESTFDTGVTFVNSYKPGATTAAIYAQKVLDGKLLADGEFSFELLDGEDKVIDKVVNDAAGNVVFTVEVPEAGTYKYTIREVAGTDSHVTYDTAVYKVTVTAAQNAAGKLVTEVVYDTADGKMPVFKNTYKPDGTTITLEGTKKLNGRDMTAGEFKFEVRDSVNTLVATGTNDAEGKIVFTEVKLPVVGVYSLTVTEVKGNAEGVAYDDAKFEVKITVVNDNGVLVATAEYPEGGMVFTNTYEKPEEPTVPETTTPEKPKDPNVPDTGDNAKLGVWIAVLAGSVLLLIITFVVVIIPKKKGKYEV